MIPQISAYVLTESITYKDTIYSYSPESLVNQKIVYTGIEKMGSTDSSFFQRNPMVHFEEFNRLSSFLGIGMPIRRKLFGQVFGCSELRDFFKKVQIMLDQCVLKILPFQFRDGLSRTSQLSAVNADFFHTSLSDRKSVV